MLCHKIDDILILLTFLKLSVPHSWSKMSYNLTVLYYGMESKICSHTTADISLACNIKHYDGCNIFEKKIIRFENL